MPLLELCQPAGVPRASLSVLTAASGASSDPRSINTQEMTARTRRDSDDVIASESHWTPVDYTQKRQHGPLDGLYCHT